MLELGAGVGLPGLLCAQLGPDAPSQITLTDLSAHLVDRIRANAEHNAKAGIAPPEATLLNWDDEPDTSKERCEEYDLIIGADLVYNRAHVSQLVKTVLPRLATSWSTLVLMQPGRYVCEPGGGRHVFDTRNGWDELKASLEREGSVELHRMQLSLLDADKFQLQRQAGSDTADVIGSQEFVRAELELLIFHKEVLCLMPP